MNLFFLCLLSKVAICGNSSKDWDDLAKDIEKFRMNDAPVNKVIPDNNGIGDKVDDAIPPSNPHSESYGKLVIAEDMRNFPPFSEECKKPENFRGDVPPFFQAAQKSQKQKVPGPKEFPYPIGSGEGKTIPIIEGQPYLEAVMANIQSNECIESIDEPTHINKVNQVAIEAPDNSSAESITKDSESVPGSTDSITPEWKYQLKRIYRIPEKKPPAEPPLNNGSGTSPMNKSSRKKQRRSEKKGEEPKLRSVALRGFDGPALKIRPLAKVKYEGKVMSEDFKNTTDRLLEEDLAFTGHSLLFFRKVLHFVCSSTEERMLRRTQIYSNRGAHEGFLEVYPYLGKIAVYAGSHTHVFWGVDGMPAQYVDDNLGGEIIDLMPLHSPVILVFTTRPFKQDEMDQVLNPYFFKGRDMTESSPPPKRYSKDILLVIACSTVKGVRNRIGKQLPKASAADRLSLFNIFAKGFTPTPILRDVQNTLPKRNFLLDYDSDKELSVYHIKYGNQESPDSEISRTKIITASIDSETWELHTQKIRRISAYYFKPGFEPVPLSDTAKTSLFDDSGPVVNAIICFILISSDTRNDKKNEADPLPPAFCLKVCWILRSKANN